MRAAAKIARVWGKDLHAISCSRNLSLCDGAFPSRFWIAFKRALCLSGAGPTYARDCSIGWRLSRRGRAPGGFFSRLQTHCAKIGARWLDGVALKRVQSRGQALSTKATPLMTFNKWLSEGPRSSAEIAEKIFGFHLVAIGSRSMHDDRIRPPAMLRATWRDSVSLNEVNLS